MAKQSVAVTKRLKISKAQQYTLIEILVTSLVVGVSIVLGIWLIKYIHFNNKIISEKKDAVSAYEKTIINVGACSDSDKDGKMSDSELDKCDPNKTEAKEGTLSYDIMNVMADNSALESVARESLNACYDADSGEKINFNIKYQDAKNDEEKEQYLDMIKMCSALRVIPDALPAKENIEATMASLNQIFIITGVEPESLTASNSFDSENMTKIANSSESLGIVPIAFAVDSSPYGIQTLLTNMEKSIRAFDVQSASFKWSDSGVLSAQFSTRAYFATELSAKKITKTVYGGDKKSTSSASGSMVGEEKK